MFIDRTERQNEKKPKQKTKIQTTETHIMARLQFACLESLDDKEFVLQTLQYNGGALQYVSARLKDEKDVVLKSVENDGAALFHASERLRDDWDVVIESVTEYGNGIAVCI